MNGIIVKKGVEAYTYLKKIFLSLDNIQLDYNWLISAHECNPENVNFETLLTNENCWISGKELTEMIFCEDFQ